MKIFLMGFMGSGKSSIGKRLAELLAIPFFDLDQYIESRYHFTISHLFEQFGEEVFRKLESKCLAELMKEQTMVLATGGGTPCFGNNLAVMKESGTTIYLKTNIETLTQRLQHARHNRPMIKSQPDDDIPGFIRQLLDTRESFYTQASVSFDTTSYNPDQLAQLIAEHFQKPAEADPSC